MIASIIILALCKAFLTECLSKGCVDYVVRCALSTLNSSFISMMATSEAIKLTKLTSINALRMAILF